VGAAATRPLTPLLTTPSKAATCRSGPAYRDLRRLNAFTDADRSCAALGVFEDRLAETGTGFLVGDAVTYVDLALFYILFELGEADVVPDWAERFDFPYLGSFVQAMQARPAIDNYLKDERRMPRYTRPGYTYCAGLHSPAPHGAGEGPVSEAFLEREQNSL